MEINTKEDFDAFIKTEDGFKIAQPIIDKKVQSGIETFMKNKNIPDLTARLENIEKAVNEKDDTIKKMELDHYLFVSCNKQNVPYDLVRDFHFQDTKSIDLKLESYKREIGNVRMKDMQSFMNENKFIPSGAISIKSGMSNMSQSEIIRMETLGQLDAMIEHNN